jgi:hypothetical protein
MMDKLKICKQTRKIAAEALYKTLQKVLKSKKPISEVDFRNMWLLEMRKSDSIFPDGWYTPPPHGMGVLFATGDDYKRIKFKSLRMKDYWPRKDVYLDKDNGYLLFYCSPVDRKTFAIGDFGLSIYLGKDKKIQRILKQELNVIIKIYNFAKKEMTIADVGKYAKKIIKQNNFSNEWWVSITDSTGTNYGHTIPATDNDWTDRERKILNGKKSWQAKLNVISKKRKFLNSLEATVINPGLAFTIEPRAIKNNEPKIPILYFHTIAAFHKNGKKELLTNFDRIFKLTRMDYML